MKSPLVTLSKELLVVLLIVAAVSVDLVAGFDFSEVDYNFGSIFPDAKVIDPCAGKPDGHFTNDVSSCEGYFSCQNGTGRPLTCPDGYYFDEAKQECNYADAVNCVGCPPDGISTMPDSLNCTRFILCYGGVKLPMECAPGLRFDQTTGQCGLAADVPCNIQCPPGIQAPEDIVFIPSDSDCVSYAICFNGTAVEFQCPDHTHFNRETKQCDTIESANCPLTTTTTTTTTTTSTPPLARRIRSTGRKEHNIECPADGVVFLPSPTDCASYYICNEGEPILRRCAANLVFDLMSNNCNFPAESVCVTDNKPTTATVTESNNLPKKPDVGKTAPTPSKTAATPSGPAPRKLK